MRSHAQHLDLSEKNFLEVDSHLLADAFSRFFDALAGLASLKFSKAGLCIVEETYFEYFANAYRDLRHFQCWLAGWSH